MKEKTAILQQSDRYIMEKLWEKSPMTTIQLYHELKDELGWSKSTVFTLLSRMTEKGIIYYKEDGKAKQYYPALLLSTALFLTIGCGKKESPESFSAGSADGQTQASSSGTPAGEAGQALAKVPALTQGDPLFVTKYIPLTLNFPNSDNYGKLIRTDSYGSRLYLLTACKDLSDEADIWQYALYLFDGDTQQLEELPFTLSLPGREAYSVKSMELVNDSELSFRLSEPQGEDYHDFLVTTDLEGNLLSLEKDFPDRESYPWNPDFRENRIVFDSPDGSTIFCEWDADNESSSLFRFDRDTNGRRLFGSLDGEFI